MNSNEVFSDAMTFGLPLGGVLAWGVYLLLKRRFNR
jgi:hypothetical protein